MFTSIAAMCPRMIGIQEGGERGSERGRRERERLFSNSVMPAAIVAR